MVSEDFMRLPSGLHSCSSWNQTLGRCLVSLTMLVLFMKHVLRRTHLLLSRRVRPVFGVECFRVDTLLKAVKLHVHINTT